MSKYLASNLTRGAQIPIYVHSEQWSQMRSEDLTSLWKTIIHSFRYFDAPIGWVDGAEQEFIKIALKTGLFRIIFDGFDEYILWNHGNVDALETVTALHNLAQDTGARILLTSRTTFWEAEIGDKHSAQNTFLYKIEPFDLNHARNYFLARFPDDSKKVSTATQLFQDLKGRTNARSNELVGRGFFLYLIADLVDRSKSTERLMPEGESAITWIMDALCERERTRQQLSLTAEQQFELLSEFATLLLSGEAPSSDNLRMTIGVLTNAQPDQVTNLVGDDGANPGKLRDHPLLKQAIGRPEWYFIQDQVMFALLALNLLKLSNNIENLQPLKTFTASSGFTSNLQTEVATTLIEHLSETTPKNSFRETVKSVIKALLRCSTSGSLANRDSQATSLACTFAMHANNHEFPKGSSRIEKSEGLIELFPDGNLQNLWITGTLARLDLAGITFRNCHFDKVSWANCRLTDFTTFQGCRFSGGSIQSSEGFGKANWNSECHFDRDALVTIDSERVREGRRAYSSEDLKLDIGNFIKKFVPKEGAGIRTVEERALIKGPVFNSLHRDTVLEYLKRYIIEPHHIPGVESTGFHVRESAIEAVIHFSGNGFFTGALSNLYTALRQKLNL